MSDRSFTELRKANEKSGRYLCIGLDLDEELITQVCERHWPYAKESRQSMYAIEIIKTTAEITAAYKLNPAFYHGPEGRIALHRIIEFIHLFAPHAVVILDGKFADIAEDTNRHYAIEAFEVLGADAITVIAQPGKFNMWPFLDRADKGVYVVCRMSGVGSSEYQDEDLMLPAHIDLQDWPLSWVEMAAYGHLLRPHVKLYQFIAYQADRYWNYNGNCGLVMAAEQSDVHQLEYVRQIAPDLPILLPGIGAQGGDIGKNSLAARKNFLLSASRSITFAGIGDDFAEAAYSEANRIHWEIRSHIVSDAIVRTPNIREQLRSALSKGDDK